MKASARFDIYPTYHLVKFDMKLFYSSGGYTQIEIHVKVYSGPSFWSLHA